MLLDNHTKQSPIVGVAGLGGGINSYIFLSSGGDYVISKSLRFNSGDAAYLSRTPSATGNRRTWTWSNWIKRSNLGSEQFLLKSDVGGGNARDAIRFESGDTLRVFFNGTNGGDIVTTQVFRDPSAWYHLVLAVDTTQATSANRVKIYINGSQITDFSTETYPTQNYDTGTFVSGKDSTIANDQNSNYLNGYLADLHFVDGQALTPTEFGVTDDDGVWQPKKYSGSHGTNGFHLDFKDNSSNAALGYDAAGSNNWTVTNLTAFQSKESANWLAMATGTPFSSSHLLSYAFDGNTSTQAAAGQGNTMSFTPSPAITGISKIRIKAKRDNGVTDTGLFTLNGTAIGGSWSENSTATVEITTLGGSAITQLTNLSWSCNPNDNNWFGVYTIEIYYGGSYKTLVTNTTAASNVDSLIDSPSQSVADETDTGVGGQITGNYATMSAVGKTKSEYFTEDGNLTCGNSSAPSGGSGSRGYVPSTIGFKTGKWYCECVTTRASDGDIDFAIGIFSQDASGYYQNNGTTYNVRPDGKLSAPSNLVASYGTAWADGDVIGIKVDLDSSPKTIQWFKNNVAIANAFTISTDHTFFFGYGADGGGGGRTYKATWNFGQRAFAYTAPSGFKCLTVENLSDPTGAAAEPNKYFDTNIWDGNGTSRNITTTLSPDFVWIKGRSHATNNMIYDAVRGPTKVIYADTNSDEATQSTQLTAFNNDSFTIATANDVNYSGRTYVGYAWDAGDSNTTIAASSLNSSVYNQSAVWSGMCSPSPSSGTFANGFDGSLTTTFAGGISAGAYFTFTPTGGISFSNNIRVYNGAVSNASYKYNGGSATSFPTNSWTTVASGGGTMTTFAVTRGETDVHGWYAIEVDGKILVDYGATPATNVPSITSTVRANPTAGFSIVSYTNGNVTVAHGLSSPPELILTKRIDADYTWGVYSKLTTRNAYLALNSTQASSAVSGMWGSAEPTSSVFGSTTYVAPDGASMIAYCFAPVAGYSSIGSFSGAGSSGPFIYTGMRPSWIMIKRTDNTGNWTIWDTTRQDYNALTKQIFANTSGVEQDISADAIDALSNGFMVRSSSAFGGGTFLYMAFAEHPFNSSRAR
jgi:hypothetical protein